MRERVKKQRSDQINLSITRSTDFYLQGDNHESEIEVKETRVESDGEDIGASLGHREEDNGSINFYFPTNQWSAFHPCKL